MNQIVDLVDLAALAVKELVAKSKSAKEDEDLRGNLRSLIKENRALRKRLRQLEKSRHIWTQYNLDSDENVLPPNVVEEISCPTCPHGTLLLIDLGIRNLWSCSSCTYRKIVIK